MSNIHIMDNDDDIVQLYRIVKYTRQKQLARHEHALTLCHTAMDAQLANLLGRQAVIQTRRQLIGIFRLLFLHR